jgi:TP901 family phage tail tape measure protein
MSGASDIGIRISMEGGKEAATQAAAVANALKDVGDAAKDAGAGGVTGSGGIDILTASLGKLDESGLVAGSSLTELAATASATSAETTLALGKTDLVLDQVAASEARVTTSTGFMGTAFGLTGDEADKASAKITGMGKALTLTSLAVGAIVVAETAKMALAYDATTTSIEATANISTSSADAITNSFLHTSSSVTFSAQAMASAFRPVAGQLQSITHGALDTRTSMMLMNATMNLATASNEALGTATSSVTDILQNYSLGVDKANTVSNILYNTGRLTATSSDELASSVDSLHARLGQLVPSLSDTAGLLYDLAQHGVSGSRGIRMATGAIETLMSRTPAVNSMLEVLGLSVNSFVGPNGKFVGMADAIGILQPKLAGLSQPMRILAEQALFGQGAAEAFGKTVLAGATAYDKARAAVTRQNAVQEAAAKVTKSLGGQIDLLKKDFDNMGISVGQFVLPKLVAIAKWMERNKPIVEALAIVIGTVLVGAMIAWIATVAIATVELIAFGLAVLAVTWPYVALIAVLILVGVYWHQIWTGMKNIFDLVWHYLDGILHNDFVLALMGPVGGLIFLAEHWKTVWNVMRDVVRDVWNFLRPIFNAVKQGLSDIGKVAEKIGGVFGSGLHMLGFAEGGVVPGPQGAPMLAMVHGGEVITPPQNIYNATNTAMTPVMLGQAVSKIAPGNANSSSVPSQVIANSPGGAGQPMVIQLVVDRRVLAELVYTEMQQSYARR